MKPRAISLLPAALLLAWAAASAARGEEILVLKSRDLPPFNQAVAGFMQARKQLAPEVAVQQRTLPAAAREAEVFGGARPAAVMAVGTEAARWAVSQTQLPVVFCMVLNARENVLAGLSDAAAGRVAGVTLNIPLKAQFGMLREVLPKARRIGIIYDPKNFAAAAEEAKAAATALGLELVTREVSNESELSAAMAWIGPRIDVLWAPMNTTVFNSRSVQFVLLQMLQRKVPVVGFSENTVKAGALLAPRVDYQAVGQQTAGLLQAMLKSGKPSPDAVQPPQQFDLIVNGRVNRIVGKPVVASARPPVSFINED